MDAVSKYPWGREHLTQGKWGAYGDAADGYSDLAVLHRAREDTGAASRTGSTGRERSFECQLMDWCDDVTYAVHDVEDFFMIGMIPLDRIFGTELHDVEQVTALGRSTGEQAGSAQAHQTLVTDEWLIFRQYLQDKWGEQNDYLPERRQTDNAFLDGLRDGLIGAYGTAGWDAAPGSIRARRYSHRRTSNLIKHFAGANVGVDGDPLLHRGDLLLDVPVTYRRDVSERELRYQCDLLKELIWKYVIGLPGLQTQQAGQERIIVDLVEIYTNDVNLLPTHYLEVAEEGSGFTRIADVTLPDGCLKRLAEIRAAADYIASLTEPQALALHKRLTGVSLGGFRDFV